jgi:hypothetical protein
MNATRAPGGSIVLIAAFWMTGCAPPCDRWCDATADYIEFCLASGSQGSWVEAGASASGGWGFWGYGSSDEYVGACKTDMDAQLAASADADVLSRVCGDEANAFATMADRGQCGELP